MGHAWEQRRAASRWQAGFLPGDDLVAEFEAMSMGGRTHFGTLVADVNHFAADSRRR
jgi:hypothetical protein